jgi:OPA family sugar phosphate sensor protein UhpC-like MFS transporter
MPLSIIVERFGWAAYFTTLVAACGAALLLLAPMAGLRSYGQQDVGAAPASSGDGRLKAA